MATVYNTSNNPAFTSALSASLSGGDTLILNQFSTPFTSLTDISSVDLLLIRIMAGFSGTFDSSPLTAVVNQTSTGKVINESNSPKIILKSSSTSGVLYQVQHSPVIGGGVMSIQTATVTNLLVTSGYCTVGSDATATNVYVFGGQCTLTGSSNAVTALEVRGGNVTLERDVTTLSAYGGTVMINNSGVTPTTVNIEQGAVVKIRDGGTITTLNGKSGTLDLTELSRPLTITNSTFYPQLRLLKNSSTDQLLTFTNPTTRAFGYEGVITTIA